MSTSFNALLASDASIKANLIVEKAISKGVRGVDGLKTVENMADNNLKVKILTGTYIYDPSFIIWSDSDLVVGGFTAAVSERYDIVYLDVVTDTSIPAPDGGTVVKIAEDAASVPAEPEGHRYVGLWRIHRTAGSSAITQAEIDAGQDLRIIPSEVMHTHNLVAGAADVTATKDEINQALDGITADVTDERLSELCGSDPTALQLNELVGGASTVLHTHNSTNSVETPSGIAIPAAGVLKITQSGQAQVSAAGDTINIHLASDNLGNHTATQDLNMVDNKVINVADPTADQDVVNKRTLDDAIANGLNGYAKYNAEHDFDLNPTGGVDTHQKIANLKDGAQPKDAINKGQLDAAVEALGGSLANLDSRYKIGNPDGSSNPSDPNYHVNKQAWGNLDLHDYKIENSATINKVTDLPKTLVNKSYVDDEIAEAVEDLMALISGFYKNPAEVDLNMTGPYGAKKIIALQDPLDALDAVNKRYVDSEITRVIGLIPVDPGEPQPGDNLGNHTATTNLNMNYKAIGRLVMPHQDYEELTEGDMLGINRKYLFDTLNGVIEDIPEVELPDFSRFAKIGPSFDADKNVLPLHMAVSEGGEVNVRGKDGKGLLVIKPGAEEAAEDIVSVDSRIRDVHDPIDDNDVVNFKTLRKWAVTGGQESAVNTTLEFEVAITNTAYPSCVTLRSNFGSIATIEKGEYVSATRDTLGACPGLMSVNNPNIVYMSYLDKLPSLKIASKTTYGSQLPIIPASVGTSKGYAYGVVAVSDGVVANSGFSFFIPLRITIKSEHRSIFKGLKYNYSIIFKDGNPARSLSATSTTPVVQVPPAIIFPYKLFPTPNGGINYAMSLAATVANGDYPRKSTLTEDSSLSYPTDTFNFGDDGSILLLVLPWHNYQQLEYTSFNVNKSSLLWTPYVGRYVVQLKPAEKVSTEWWRS